MGVHFLNPANIGPNLDPAKPQVLIYEPVGNKLVLAAAEWFVLVAVVPNGVAPTIFGQTLENMHLGILSIAHVVDERDLGAHEVEVAKAAVEKDT